MFAEIIETSVLTLTGKGSTNSTAIETGSLQLTGKGSVNSSAILTGALQLTGKGSVNPSAIETGALQLTGKGSVNPSAIQTGVLQLTGKGSANPSAIQTGVLQLTGKGSANPSAIVTGQLELTGNAKPTVATTNITTGSLILTGIVPTEKATKADAPAPLPPPPTVLTPKIIKSAPSARSKQTVRDKRFVSMRILNVRPKNGVNPFLVKDVKAAFADRQKTDTPSSSAPPERPEQSPQSPIPQSPPSYDAVPALAAGFSCAGKVDGNYCKDSNTLVFCYRETEANSQPCIHGCDTVTKTCHPYKP